MIICQHCGKETPEHKYGGEKKYCSEKCRHSEEIRRYRVRHPEKVYGWKPDQKCAPPKEEAQAQFIKRCEFCGMTYEGRKRKYCSKKCSNRSSKARATDAERAKNAERSRKARQETGYKFARSKRKNDPLYYIKENARAAARNAVKSGRLDKPTHCKRCQIETVNLQGHHYRGYDRPLDVIWLCHRCHAIVEAHEKL
jgi:hypothetical protein